MAGCALVAATLDYSGIRHDASVAMRRLIDGLPAATLILMIMPTADNRGIISERTNSRRMNGRPRALAAIAGALMGASRL